MIPAWLMAVASALPVIEDSDAPFGEDPVDAVFCGARWVALADVTVVQGGAPFGPDLLRADVDEVLVVHRGVEEVPAALLAEVDGTKVTPGRVLLVSGPGELLGGFEFSSIAPHGPRAEVFWKGEYVDTPQWEQFLAIPVGGVVEHATRFHLRDGRTLWITHRTSYDDVLAEIRRLAPRLLDARRRFKRCGFRKGSPERLPERGVRLDPPEPSASPPPSLPYRGP